MNTETVLLIAIMVAFFLVIVQVARLYATRPIRADRAQPQPHFVAEYSRPAAQAATQNKIESDLYEHRQQVRAPSILPLSDEQKNHFTLEWLAVQAVFAQNPGRGMKEAEQTLRKIMGAKGYPADDFNELLNAMSTDFPAHVTQFRKLHLLAMRGGRDNPSPEDMCRAMRQARILFEEILYADLVEAVSF